MPVPLTEPRRGQADPKSRTVKMVRSVSSTSSLGAGSVKSPSKSKVTRSPASTAHYSSRLIPSRPPPLSNPNASLRRKPAVQAMKVEDESDSDASASSVSSSTTPSRARQIDTRYPGPRVSSRKWEMDEDVHSVLAGTSQNANWLAQDDLLGSIGLSSDALGLDEIAASPTFAELGMKPYDDLSDDDDYDDTLPPQTAMRGVASPAGPQGSPRQSPLIGSLSSFTNLIGNLSRRPSEQSLHEDNALRPQSSHEYLRPSRPKVAQRPSRDDLRTRVLSRQGSRDKLSSKPGSPALSRRPSSDISSVYDDRRAQRSRTASGNLNLGVAAADWITAKAFGQAVKEPAAQKGLPTPVRYARKGAVPVTTPQETLYTQPGRGSVAPDQTAPSSTSAGFAPAFGWSSTAENAFLADNGLHRARSSEGLRQPSSRKKHVHGTSSAAQSRRPSAWSEVTASSSLHDEHGPRHFPAPPSRFPLDMLDANARGPSMLRRASSSASLSAAAAHGEHTTPVQPARATESATAHERRRSVVETFHAGLASLAEREPFANIKRPEYAYDQVPAFVSPFSSVRTSPPNRSRRTSSSGSFIVTEGQDVDSQQTGSTSDHSNARPAAAQTYQRMTGALVRVSGGLAAPLRPLVALAFFLSIACVAAATLTSVMMASYGLTIFDDVALRAMRGRKAAGQYGLKLGESVRWGRELVVSAAENARETLGAVADKGRSQSQHHPSRRHSRRTPANDKHEAERIAIRARLLPRSMQEMLDQGELTNEMLADAERSTRRRREHFERTDSHSTTSDGSDSGSTDTPETEDTKPGSPRSGLPPRPPLAILLPSVMVTLLFTFWQIWTNYFRTLRRPAARSA